MPAGGGSSIPGRGRAAGRRTSPKQRSGEVHPYQAARKRAGRRAIRFDLAGLRTWERHTSLFLCALLTQIFELDVQRGYHFNLK